MWFRRKPKPQQYRWWLITRHRALGVDAFLFGPFRSRDVAEHYPSTFGGFVDAPAFGRDYDRRVERQPKGVKPRLITALPDPEPAMGPMDLYLSTGHIPTGRTAEILRLAQESHDRRRGKGQGDVVGG
jgi:hypothetical protein